LQKDDNLFPYFISSFALYKVEELFRKNILDTKNIENINLHIILVTKRKYSRRI